MKGPVIALIQARMGSSRMPGKTLTPLLGKPMIDWQLERLSLSTKINQVCVLTSRLPVDDPLAKHLNAKTKVFRGSEEDVLARFYEGVKIFFPESELQNAILIRLTGDCPLSDPHMIDDGIKKFESYMNQGCRYMGYDKSLPSGMDFEIFTWSALKEAHEKATEPFEREHVTPYLWKNPAQFGYQCYVRPGIQTGIRFSVDYPEDLKFVESLMKENQGSGVFLGIDRVFELLAKNPELASINSNVIKDEGLVKSCLQSESFQVMLNGVKTPKFGVQLINGNEGNAEFFDWCLKVGIRVLVGKPSTRLPSQFTVLDQLPAGWGLVSPENPDWSKKVPENALCVKTNDRFILGSTLASLCRIQKGNG